jgi:hypothetical protein
LTKVLLLPVSTVVCTLFPLSPTHDHDSQCPWLLRVCAFAHNTKKQHCAAALRWDIALHGPPILTQSDTLYHAAQMAQWGPCPTGGREPLLMVEGALGLAGWLTLKQAIKLKRLIHCFHATCVEIEACVLTGGGIKKRRNSAITYMHNVK